MSVKSKAWIEIVENGQDARDPNLFTQLCRVGDVKVNKEVRRNLIVIRMENIFEKYPLRRKVMKPLIEAARIKEYILQTSLLHYRVRWKVNVIIDDIPDVISLPSCDSVMNSFAKKFHHFSSIIFDTEVGMSPGIAYEGLCYDILSTCRL